MYAYPTMPVLEIIAGICLSCIGYSIDRANRKRDRCLDIETLCVISGVLAIMDGGLKIFSVPSG